MSLLPSGVSNDTTYANKVPLIDICVLRIKERGPSQNGAIIVVCRPVASELVLCSKSEFL